MTEKNTISSEFPFDSKYLNVNNSKMHYIDVGTGDPVLFLHGNPTSSYLWRNIIPHISPFARCIAPDLIGMGKSDKPNIGYRFLDHYAYLEGFIRELNLSNLTLVIHDWGSGLGFHYANINQNNIKGIAFMEAIVRTMSWKGFNKDFKIGFKLMRTPVIGWFMISVMNVFLKQIMPKTIIRELSSGEKAAYGKPFETVVSRKPVRQWPCEIPIDGTPADVHEIISDYSKMLQTSEIPKLLLFGNPGGIIDEATLDWCRKHLKNLTTVSIGAGIHYLQEDNPENIGKELAKWYKSLRV